MNEQEQKQFIQYLIKRLKEVHHLTVIYRVAIQFAKDYGVTSMDDVLESARVSPATQAETDRYFQGFDELLGTSHLDDPGEAVQAWLQQWKSSGKPN
ncbi:hypothetical protein [Terracidiphilus sp.]|jgi:hypothetical protein|uniref:hypothetical protein n=1 Tax=Terracidiphilus sp. TaxID=1964191 RepID=UPI003C251D0A